LWLGTLISECAHAKTGRQAIDKKKMKESIVLLGLGFAVFQILAVLGLTLAMKRPARKLQRASGSQSNC
jgi:hypothetical protein